MMRRGAIAAAAAFTALLAGGSQVAAAPRWAPASRAAIHPGVSVVVRGGQCTANFVFYAGREVYLGEAAHCSSSDGDSAIDGCHAHSYPLGTRVTVEGARRPGKLAYSSWLAMRRAGERAESVCTNNDFALIRIDRGDRARVNPSIPFWGGPTGLSSTTRRAQSVYSYGNSGLRAGIAALSPKRGTSLGQGSGGWLHTVYTVTPGIPGDSGSAFIDDQGRAFGVLSTVEVLPLPASNGVGDLSRELRYLRRHSALRVTLARGTRSFSGTPLR